MKSIQENYKDLNNFHAATVVMIAVGIGLISMITFLTLPQSLKIAVADSVKIFDAREEVAIQTQNMKFIFDTQSKYHEEFYLAFTEVLSFPDEALEIKNILASGVEPIASYSDVLASTKNLTQVAQKNQNQINGEVLGSFIASSLPATEKRTVTDCGGPTFKPIQFPFKYTYQKPEIINQISKMIAKN